MNIWWNDEMYTELTYNNLPKQTLSNTLYLIPLLFSSFGSRKKYTSSILSSSDRPPFLFNWFLIILNCFCAFHSAFNWWLISFLPCTVQFEQLFYFKKWLIELSKSGISWFISRGMNEQTLMIRKLWDNIYERCRAGKWGWSKLLLLYMNTLYYLAFPNWRRQTIDTEYLYCSIRQI